MPASTSASAALPLAHVVLRILTVVNWTAGAGIAVLLLFMPHEQWILTSLNLSPSPDADRFVLGLRAIAVIGLGAIVLNAVILERLLAIVDTVRAGDPFVAANAARLQTIAWVLLSLQIMSMVIGAIGRAISSPEHPFYVNAGFSVNGWVAVLLIFVLARVFAEGAGMRDDLAGTV